MMVGGALASSRSHEYWSDLPMEWTYRKVDLNNLPRKAEDVDILNDAGKEGWELVQITVNNVAYMKRPVLPEPKSRKTAKPGS
jgi:hypothetical protein